jgi:hypothetical protein
MLAYKPARRERKQESQEYKSERRVHILETEESRDSMVGIHVSMLGIPVWIA